MTDTTLDSELFDIADAFIHLVNEHSQKVGSEKAGSALTYAAARFSAYIVASNSADLDEMKAVREESKNNFMAIYEKYLDINLSQYEDNYEMYIQKHRNT
ncbi:MAG: DUF3144 domain-containing protein [Gammaproteobacteria bacterium]|nr:DUF3144 domain-containing protein [Gammaproteobacteria bacterium]